MGLGYQHHAPAALVPGKDSIPILYEVGWTSEPVWTGAENIATIGIRSPDRPSRSESLYQLSYPANRCGIINVYILMLMFSIPLC